MARIAADRRFDFVRGKPGRGLVEQQKLWLCGQRAGYFEKPLLAVSERARLRVGGAFQPDEVEQLAGARLDLALGLPRAAAAHQCREHPAPGVEMATDLDVLQNRKVLEELHELEGANEARRRDLLRRPRGDVVAREHDAPGVRRLKTGNQVEQRGLAGAVRADHRGDAAFRRLRDRWRRRRPRPPYRRVTPCSDNSVMPCPRATSDCRGRPVPSARRSAAGSGPRRRTDPDSP